MDTMNTSNRRALVASLGRGVASAVAALLLLPGSALGQEGSEVVKIAIVDITRAVGNSSQGKEAEKALTSLMENKRDTLRPEEEELKRLSDEYESQRFVLSKEALQDRELELMKRKRDLERDMAAAREEIEIEERKRMQPIMQRVDRVIRQIGREKGFTLIIEKSNPFVRYYQESLDITDIVTARLNEAS
jgi:outer membrane protein